MSVYRAQAAQALVVQVACTRVEQNMDYFVRKYNERIVKIQKVLDKVNVTTVK